MSTNHPWLAGVVAMILPLSHPAQGAESPLHLPFQGRLVDAAGRTIPDGMKVVRFQIFREAVDGVPAWNGEIQKVTVNGGLINVILGTKAKLDLVDFSQTLYLEITVDVNGPEGLPDGSITPLDPPMRPRQVLLPAPFATESANSKKLAGQDWSAILADGATDPRSGFLAGNRIQLQSLEANQLGITLSNQLHAIFTHIEESKWRPFTTNIMELVPLSQQPGEMERWEYAVERNGGFRRLTVSAWNKGWRVITEPYMTGDFLTGGTGTGFMLGGSMWIWGTYDGSDDDGVRHFYYFYFLGRVGPDPEHGNGLTGAERGGEGWFYRRRRQ